MFMGIVAQRIPAKERIRGPGLAVLVKRGNGVPMEEALRRADEAGAVIASNKRLGKALVGSDEWSGIDRAFPCWSGTMAAYDKPDKKIGKTIVYVDPGTGTRYVFPVPEEHQGKKNIVLVAEHPDFTLEIDAKTRIVHAKQVGVVSKFPVQSHNWYVGDPKYGIPTGKKSDADNEAARYLWRIEKRVGLVTRGYAGSWCAFSRRGVGLDDGPSLGFGMAVEAALPPVPEKSQAEAAEKGILISGVTLDMLRALVGNADASLAELAKNTKPQKLKAIRQLLKNIRAICSPINEV